VISFMRLSRLRPRLKTARFISGAHRSDNCNFVVAPES
jgi:hypothetical protein